MTLHTLEQDIILQWPMCHDMILHHVDQTLGLRARLTIRWYEATVRYITTERL